MGGGEDDKRVDAGQERARRGSKHRAIGVAMTSTDEYVLRRKDSGIGWLGPWLHAAGFNVYKTRLPQKRSMVSGRNNQLEERQELPDEQPRGVLSVGEPETPRAVAGVRPNIADHTKTRVCDPEAQVQNGQPAEAAEDIIENCRPPDKDSPVPVSDKCHQPSEETTVPHQTVDLREFRKYKTFFRQYVANQRAGLVDPYSERGLSAWGIPQYVHTYDVLRGVLLDELSWKTTDDHGANALHQACKCGSVKAVERLFERRVFHPMEPTNGGQDGWLPIHFAAMNNHDEPQVLHQVIDNCVPLIRRTRRKDCKNNHDAKIVTMSTGDRTGKNTLHISALFGRAKLFGAIHELACTAPNTKAAALFLASCDKHDRTALHFAAYGGHADLVKRCVHDCRIPLTARDKMRRTCLHYIAMGKKVSLLETENLLDFVFTHESINANGPAFANAQSIAGITPICCACKSGNGQVVNYLLAKCGANPTIKDMNGDSAIFFALRAHGYEHALGGASALELVKRLLPYYGTLDGGRGGQPGHPVDLNVLVGDEESTLLMCACQNNQFEVVEYLLKQRDVWNIHVDLQRKIDGASAVHICAQYGSFECLLRLVNDGRARYTARDNEGRTPLYVAIAKHNVQATEFLLKTASQRALSEIEFKEYMEMPCTQGLTPFLVACALPDARIATLLESYGASMTATTLLGNTALHIAAANVNDGSVVRMLDEQGAGKGLIRKVNAINVPPFEVARYWNNKSSKASLYTLMVSGLDKAEANKTEEDRAKDEARSSRPSSAVSSTSSSRRLFRPVADRPLTPFARQYSANVVADMNAHSRRTKSADHSHISRKNDKEYWTGPLKKKTFRFKERKVPSHPSLRQ